MRNICNGAGIEQPTLYYFFGSKEGLFFSIINRLRDCYNQFDTKDDDTVERMQPEQKLYCMFCNGIRFAMGNRQAVSFYYRYSLFPPAELKKKVNAFLEKVQEEYRQRVKSIIGESIRQGAIKKDHEDACLIYYTFVNNHLFNVTFSYWEPEETELKELWDMFFKCRLQDMH